MSRAGEAPPVVAGRRADRCLLALLESITQHAVVAADADGVIQFWNEGARRAHGYTSAQVVGLKTVADLFGPPLRPCVVGTATGPQVGQLKPAGVWEGEVECAHSSGDLFNAHIVVTPRSAVAGAADGWVLVGRRVPVVPTPIGRVVAGAALPGAQLLARMAHEMRDPLVGVVGLSRILLTKLAAGPVDPELLVGHLGLMQSSAYRLLGLIERLVEVARSESEGAPVALTSVDCRGVVADALVATREVAEAKGVRVQSRPMDEPVAVATDAVLVRRILRELVDNAVRHTNGRQVVVWIDAASAQQVTIGVRDDGPGIAAAEQSRIFEAFERGETLVGPEDGGSGLGLFLARRLASRVHAQIAVHSEQGQGSTFTVTIPRPPVDLDMCLGS